LDKFNITGNFTYVKSKLKMQDAEFRARENIKKEGQTIDDTREMAGQAPYIVNAGLGYNNIAIGMDAGFFYNVKGRTLTIVGGGLFPDVYAVPFHSLNFNMNKTIGSARRAAISVNITNMLGDKREEVYSAFRAVDQYFYAFSPGTEIGVGFTYSF
jgi:hypothetical protein